MGLRTLQLGHVDDVQTVNGVFLRNDYPISSSDKLVFDVGANIGIVSAFALTRGPGPIVWAYEPVPSNVHLLRQNTQGLHDRVTVHEKAVHTHTANVCFGIEPVGKYGGIRPHHGITEFIHVPALGINDVLERACLEYQKVSVLKIDTEGTEFDLLRAIDAGFWPRIERVYAENTNMSANLPPGFARWFRYNIEELRRVS